MMPTLQHIKLKAMRISNVPETATTYGMIEFSLSGDNLPVVCYTDRLTKVWNTVRFVYVANRDKGDIVIQGQSGETVCIRVLLPDDLHFLVDACRMCCEIRELTDELSHITSNLLPIEHAAIASPKSSQHSILNEAEEIIQVARSKLESVPIQYEVKCVYCSISHSCTPQQMHFYFKRHPYVSHDFSGKPLHLCHTCYRNWEIYRKDAEDHGELLLEGEKNEEACAVCSDIVDEITLCDRCPRSYCKPCLDRILSAAEIEKMKKCEDWRCMMCDAAAQASASVMETPRETPRKGKSKSSKSNGSKSTKSSTSSKSNKSSSTSTSTTKVTAATKNNSKSILTSDIPNISRSSSSEVAVPPKPTKASTSKRAKEEKIDPDILPLPDAELKNLPPVNKRLDEYYYFSQYVKELSRTQGQRTTTDDFCFLCKDGGELVECDYMSKNGNRCQKVYHEYCLGFKVVCDPWCCCRHSCTVCRKSDIKYQCKYCTLSLCSRCRVPWCEMQQNDTYRVPDVKEPVDNNVESIVCCNCVRMIDTCIERTMLFEYHRNGVMKKFPPKKGGDRKSDKLTVSTPPQKTGAKRRSAEEAFSVSSTTKPRMTTRARRKTFDDDASMDVGATEEQMCPEVNEINGTNSCVDSGSENCIDLTEFVQENEEEINCNNTVAGSDATSAETEIDAALMRKEWTSEEVDIIIQHLSKERPMGDTELARYLLSNSDTVGAFAFRTVHSLMMKIYHIRAQIASQQA